jgi:hypothetical protein
MHEKLIRCAALAGLACVVASVFAFAWRAGVYGCPVAEGCDVPVRTSNHPYTGLGIALLIVGILALGVAIELRRRAGAREADSVAG